MFKVPAWEEDIPKSKLNFTKRGPKKKTSPKETNVPEIPQQNIPKRPSFKHKNQLKTKTKLKLSNKIQKNKLINSKPPENKDVKQKAKKKPTKQKKSVANHSVIIDTNIDLNNCDTDKLDELILDEKKKKLNTVKNDDIEEILFKENSETNENKTKENSKNILNGKVKKNKKQNNELNKSMDDESVREHKIGKYVRAVNYSEEDTTNKNTTNVNKSNNKQIRSKLDRKKDIFKALLQKENHRSPINISKSSTLRDRMMERLKAAKFRYLNEMLYTSSGSDAQQMFQTDPDAFQTYHEGYQQQVKKWPVKPLDVIIKTIQKMPKTSKIADMGCGEAELSRRIPHSVRSFDLISTAPGVEACDMAHTPLLSSSVDAAVYCLALMGTDLTQYLLEANRVLKIGWAERECYHPTEETDQWAAAELYLVLGLKRGHLLIAEVESRFQNVETFTKEVQKLGFRLKKLDKSHEVFFFMEFTKVRDPPVKKAKLPALTLKPCIYKKR